MLNHLRLESKYWGFQHYVKSQNQHWDHISTCFDLEPFKSKSRLPTTGIFWYGKSHICITTSSDYNLLINKLSIFLSDPFLVSFAYFQNKNVLFHRLVLIQPIRANLVIVYSMIINDENVYLSIINFISTFTLDMWR